MIRFSDRHVTNCSGEVHAVFGLFVFLSVAVGTASPALADGPKGDIGLAATTPGWIDRFLDATNELWWYLACSPDVPPSKDPDERMRQLTECADQTPAPKVPDPAVIIPIDTSIRRVLGVLDDPENTADPERVAELRASLYSLMFRLGI